ncbi:MAG: MBL fold metallo-hydrolase [Phycisphaerales bacterium]|nr:MBL fold metallo-hydrolase [Phycisphaerales bacterium]
MHLTFLGATRQVTGSRYLLEAGGLRIMVDCGLFQERDHLDRNWAMPIVRAGTIDFLLLTHGHLDHCGLVPRLVRGGFDAPIITTTPTVDLARLVMLDSARIQVEDAKYKRRRHKRERRRPPRRVEPLYYPGHARRAARMMRGVGFGQPVRLNDDVRVTFHESGHILGSAMIEIEVREDDRTERVVFSGDLGQWDKPLVGDPTLLEGADYVVMESTYGDRDHTKHGPIDEQLERVVNETAQRGGNLVVPTFAIERAQDLIFHLGRLRRARRIPPLSVYLDSPMAVDVTGIFRKHRSFLDEETRALFDSGDPPLRFPGLHLVRSARHSRGINGAPGSKIILSTSGMCTAGRIKHHLRQNIERPESTVVFVGYQARGTLGRRILEREPRVRIHGREYDVRATIAHINGFSAHGDRGDLLRWLGHFSDTPRRVFLTHGEESAALSLAESIRERLGLDATVPHEEERVELGASPVPGPA